MIGLIPAPHSVYAKQYSYSPRFTKKEHGAPRKPKNYKKALARAKRAVRDDNTHTTHELPCSRK